MLIILFESAVDSRITGISIPDREQSVRVWHHDGMMIQLAEKGEEGVQGVKSLTSPGGRAKGTG